MRIYGYIDKVLQIAGGMVAPPLIGLLIGRALDDAFNIEYLSIAFFLLGVLTGIWSLVKFVSDLLKKQ